MTEKKLQVIPVGGLGEFGMNCTALRYGDDILVLDAGMMFPDAELLGVDIVVPDFSYLIENKEHVRAVVLTHGHEDHIGGLPFLLNDIDAPVYGTAFTLGLVERRMEEHDMLDRVQLNRIKPGQIVEVGPFKIEFIHVTHSIVSAVMLAITTPLGVVMHTGDFKIDPTPTDNLLFDLHTVAEYGKRGVLLLLSDSTNVDRAGYTPSERAVRPRFEEIFNRADHRIVVACFSSSIHRLQQILDIAASTGRKVAFLGRSMLTTTEIAHNLGLLNIPDSTLIRPQDISAMPRNKVVVVVSGTQGEPMSAMSRIAVDNHKNLSLDTGDIVVLSSRMIPGNEKSIGRMLNHVARRGCEIIAGSMSPPIHVSGHASRDELTLMLNLVRPRFFVPIHGEYWQMSKHAKLAQHLTTLGLQDTILLESGQVLEIDELGARKNGKVSVGRICIDSGSIDEVVEDLVIRDRRHLSEDGFVIPIIAVGKNSGRAETLPEIVSRGFVSFDEGSDLMTSARQVVARTWETSSAEEHSDWGVMQEKIRVDLKRFLHKQTSRRPLIMPVILEV